MVRPPCCENPVIKKGPWTPEEDLILVSYIHQHGPCNWRSVPINTGLLRCSKSCRLRWTNYLRPGIKRGCFTPQEEGIIIHLQAMLGNRWAAIASYLPQRTDNDIKNYWNTHLKKKLKLFKEGIGSGAAAGDNTGSPNRSPAGFQGIPLISKEASILANPYSASFQSSSTYASSAENISRLLEGWTKPSVKLETIDPPQASSTIYANNNSSTSNITCNNQNDELINYDGLESLLSPEKITWPKKPSLEGEARLPAVVPAEDGESPHLTLLEKWLLDDTAGQLEGLMDRFPVNC